MANNESKHYDVFISYQRSDEKIADEIYNRLSAERVVCYMDKQRIGIGSLWRNEIYRVIRQVPFMVVLISEATLKSKEVNREILKALDNNTAILPFLLGEVNLDSDLIHLINEYNWLESGRPPDSKHLDEFIRAVVAKVETTKVKPAIRIAAPAAGDEWQPGETYSLAWEVTSPEATIEEIGVELLAGGKPLEVAGTSTKLAGTVRAWDWTIPLRLAAGGYAVRVYAHSNFGSSAWDTVNIAVAAPEAAAVPAETVPVEKVYSRKQPQKVRAKPEDKTPHRTKKTTAAACSVRLADAARSTTWTRGVKRNIEVAVSGISGERLRVGLYRDDALIHTLAELSDVELMGRLFGETADSKIIYVDVPASLSAGGYELRAVLLDAEDREVAADTASVTLQNPVERDIAALENKNYVQGAFGGVVLAVMFLGVFAIVRQWFAVVGGFDWSPFNWRDIPAMASTLFNFAKFILFSGLTGLFGNFGIILLGSSVGGVLVGLAYYLGEKTRYTMLASLAGCAGLLGVVGIAVGLFRAAGPPHPDAPPVATNTLLSDYYTLGQLAERERIKGLSGKGPSDEVLGTATRLGQSPGSATDSLGVKSLPDSLYIKPFGEKSDRYVPLSERLEKERKDLQLRITSPTTRLGSALVPKDPKDVAPGSLRSTLFNPDGTPKSVPKIDTSKPSPLDSLLKPKPETSESLIDALDPDSKKSEKPADKDQPPAKPLVLVPPEKAKEIEKMKEGLPSMKIDPEFLKDAREPPPSLITIEKDGTGLKTPPFQSVDHLRGPPEKKQPAWYETPVRAPYTSLLWGWLIGAILGSIFGLVASAGREAESEEGK